MGNQRLYDDVAEIVCPFCRSPQAIMQYKKRSDPCIDVLARINCGACRRGIFGSFTEMEIERLLKGEVE